jgi:tyrosine-protein kinase Etk/Wzc
MKQIDKKLRYLEIIVRWKKFIIYSTLIICTLVAIYSLLVDKKYQAGAKVLPPRQESYGSLIGGIANLTTSFLGGGQGGFSLPPLTSPSEVYKELLESRILAEKLIKEFNLMEEYEIKYIEEALDMFWGNLDIEVTFAGFVNITYTDSDTIRVKELMDSLLLTLDSLNTHATINYHRQNRIYFEKQLELIRNNLFKSEDNLKNFQEKYGVLEITEQVKQLLSILTDLESQKMQLIFEKGVVDHTLNKNSSQVRLLEIQINSIENEITKIKEGTNKNLAIGVNDIPDIALKYANLLREQQINETINIFVQQQYEQARFYEEKDIPTIMVLDKPRYPQIRVYPKRRNMVLIGLLFSLFLNVLFIAYKEKVSEIQTYYPEEYSRLKNLFTELFRWKKK